MTHANIFRESKDGSIDFKGSNTVSVSSAIGSVGNSKYNFDQVFDEMSTQDDVYEQAVKPIVTCVMEGFNGTVFAYGQTASGKTHTMLGENITDPAERGMIPRMVSNIF